MGEAPSESLASMGEASETIKSDRSRVDGVTSFDKESLFYTVGGGASEPIGG